MTLPTGSISLGNVNTELGKTSTSYITMNDAAVRSLAGFNVNTSSYSMNALRGKTSYVAMSLTGSGTINNTVNGPPKAMGTAYAYPTVNVANGRGPFTYNWTFIAQNSVTLSNATSQTCTVMFQGNNSTGSGTVRCTVTDTFNGSTATFDVIVRLTVNSNNA